MKRTDITRTIASLLITAAMLGVTGCGNVNTDTSSAAPKATTTAAETTEMGTMTSRSATTTVSSDDSSSRVTTTSIVTGTDRNGNVTTLIIGEGGNILSTLSLIHI